MENQKLIAGLLVVLAIAVTFQMLQLIALYGKDSETPATGQVVVAGGEEFSSYEEMMEAHHGTSASNGASNGLPQQVGGC